MQGITTLPQGRGYLSDQSLVPIGCTGDISC